MRDADAESVARVLRAAFREPDVGAIPAAHGLDLPLTGRRVRTWRQIAAGAWIAEIAGYDPVGAVFAVIEPEAAWLAGLGVVPEFRGTGLGAALAARALTFLAARERPVVGLEAAPTAVGATALYVRRGYRVADVTIRLRGSAAALGAEADLAGWQEALWSDLDVDAAGLDPSAMARVHAQPRSPGSYLLCGPDVVLLCDPDPLVPAAGGSLDLRLVMAKQPQVRVIEAAVRAAARSGSARGLSMLEVDLAMADGVLLRRLMQFGLKPIASTIRLVSDLNAYASWLKRHGPIGRWSF